MIESPVTQEIIEESTREAKREAIVNVLRARFGDGASAVHSELGPVEGGRLDELLRLAATCRTLASFRKQLSS